MATYNDSYSLPRQPLPISIVDILFPGLTNISAAFQQLQAGNSNSYAGILCICGIVVFLGRYAYTHVTELVMTYFTSTVHVAHSNEARDMLLNWISTQPFAHKASSSLASVGRREFVDDDSEGDRKKPLQYSPWNGSFSFWYKNRLLTFRRVKKESSFFPREEISVSCIGRSPEILKELFRECRMEYLKLTKNKTSIFEHQDGGWEKIGAIHIRPLDTVILDEQKKTELLEDIEDFLDPRSRAWYSRRGIPYRKGYLLYGPPGTGKSSLSLSIAGNCDLDIYILNLSSLDDSSLGKLFTKLPEQCVILIEDIDAVDATKPRQHETLKTDQREIASSTKGKQRGSVSLSSLLNVLDGVGSQEGRVLIMSTNHPERLDDALIRSGRVDMKVELGLTNRDINTRLFRAIFMRDNTPPDGKPTEDEAMLAKLAGEFANKVPEREFSPADIQLFLLKYRQSPHMAVKNVEEWVMQTREGKRQIKRADSGASEESLCGGISSTPPDKPTSSVTTLNGAQARGLAKKPTAIPDSHCCSCQILSDIRDICQREKIPSVEQSLLFNYLSDLEASQNTHDDLGHSTDGLLNLLLRFVKEIYTSTPERHSMQPAAPPVSPCLPSIGASYGLLPSVQPAPKIVENLETKLMAHLSASVKESKNRKCMAHEYDDEKAHCSGDTAVSDLLKFWEEEGWEPIVFDFDHATPDLSYGETSPGDSSSGTSFESGSEMSCEVDGIAEQAEVTEESRSLGINRQLHRQPATPPPSPITSTPVILSGNKEREMSRPIAELSMPSSSPCLQRCSCQPRFKSWCPPNALWMFPNLPTRNTWRR